MKTVRDYLESIAFRAHECPHTPRDFLNAQDAHQALKLLDEASEETRGLPPSMCLQGTFPLPYRVLVIDLEPRDYRRYSGGHDITDPDPAVLLVDAPRNEADA